MRIHGNGFAPSSCSEPLPPVRSTGVAPSAPSLLPTAGAATRARRADLATTASRVLAAAGTYLDAHPGANDVLTAAGSQPRDEAKSNVETYFLAHPGEFLDLKRIAQPLTDLRNQCGVCGHTRAAGGARRIVPAVVQGERERYMRPWRLRTKLYAPKAAIPRAATMSRTFPNGA